MANGVGFEKRPSRYRNEYNFVEMAVLIGEQRSEEIKKKLGKSRKTRSCFENPSKPLWKRRSASTLALFMMFLGF